MDEAALMHVTSAVSRQPAAGGTGHRDLPDSIRNDLVVLDGMHSSGAIS
jgi:hypothetical protein